MQPMRSSKKGFTHPADRDMNHLDPMLCCHEMLILFKHRYEMVDTLQESLWDGWYCAKSRHEMVDTVQEPSWDGWYCVRVVMRWLILRNMMRPASTERIWDGWYCARVMRWLIMCNKMRPATSERIWDDWHCARAVKEPLERRYKMVDHNGWALYLIRKLTKNRPRWPLPWPRYTTNNIYCMLVTIMRSPLDSKLWTKKVLVPPDTSQPALTQTCAQEPSQIWPRPFRESTVRDALLSPTIATYLKPFDPIPIMGVVCRL